MTSQFGWVVLDSGDEGNRTLMYSTPAVGSCVLPPSGNAPNEVGPFRSTMVLCC
ncbi:hypothetical protein RRSWK_03034 [Rhodopirellula sp. SWK7]|nr:hypothetical protein RRSWK_03034 [Rhodopirellula sp. SWK7]